MANQITVANLNNSSFVDSTSRYFNSTIIYYGINQLVTFVTYVREPIPTTPQDKYYVVTKGTEYRPDLVANQAYGVPSFWWKIMEANGMMDILEFKAGANIRIPNVIM